MEQHLQATNNYHTSQVNQMKTSKSEINGEFKMVTN